MLVTAARASVSEHGITALHYRQYRADQSSHVRV